MRRALFRTLRRGVLAAYCSARTVAVQFTIGLTGHRHRQSGAVRRFVIVLRFDAVVLL